MAELAPDGTNGWFGEDWGAPMCRPEAHVATPVGEDCLHCGEPIEENDKGSTMPMFGTPPRVVATHIECGLREVLGGALCQEGTCARCGDGSGGTTCDPPGLTPREAARAAVAAFERRHGGMVG